MKILSAGQSCFRITMDDGTVVMTDPWLGPSIIKPYETPIRAEEVDRCDVFLVSHAHIDHVDSHALRLAKVLGTTVVGSAKAARSAHRRGIRDVIAMRIGDTVEVAGRTIHAVHAEHPLADDAVGFVMEADRTFYFSGDTRYNDRLVAALKAFKIDVALLQIACAVYFFKKDGMDIPDAAELVRRLKPGVAIPMHYHDRFRQPDPEAFRKALAGTNVRVEILKLGQEIQI